MLEYKGYKGKFEFTDGVYSGRVIAIPNVVTFKAYNEADIVQAFQDSVNDYIAFCLTKDPRAGQNLQQLVAVDEAIRNLERSNNIVPSPLAKQAIALAWQLHNEIVERTTLMGLVDEWLEISCDFAPYLGVSGRESPILMTREHFAEIVARCEWIDADELHSIPLHDSKMVFWIQIALGYGDRDLAYTQDRKDDAGVYFFTAYAKDMLRKRSLPHDQWQASSTKFEADS